MSEQPSSAGGPLGSCFALCGATTSSTTIAQAVQTPFWGSPEHRQPRDVAQSSTNLLGGIYFAAFLLLGGR